MIRILKSIAMTILMVIVFLLTLPLALFSAPDSFKDFWECLKEAWEKD